MKIYLNTYTKMIYGRNHSTYIDYYNFKINTFNFFHQYILSTYNIRWYAYMFLPYNLDEWIYKNRHIENFKQIPTKFDLVE